MCRLHRHLRRLAPLACALALLAALPGAAAAAESAGLSPVLAVSAEDGSFLAPDIAVDAAGNAVVVWYGEAPGQAVPNSEIFARRYGPRGHALGPAFRVNAAARGQQRRPAVAVAPDGAFVVAWDTDTTTVWARRFTADGAPATGDIAISTGTAVDRDPDVAVAPDGTFVVAWQRTPAGAPDDVALARFDRDGTPLGAERTPRPPADAVAQINPALAALPAGQFALVWEELASDGASTIFLRRLDATGAPSGNTQSVAILPAGPEELRDPAVAADSAGAAIVAWSVFSPAGDSIAARGFTAAGAPAGPAQTVAPAGPSRRFLPAVALIGGAGYIAWGEAALTAGGPAGVAARAILASGAPAGDPLFPRPLAPGEQPALTATVAFGPGPGGEPWFAWAETGPSAAPAQSAIYARRITAWLYTTALPLVAR
jgi:hypothetical protein